MFLASGGYDGQNSTIKIWDVGSFTERVTLPCWGQVVLSIAFSPDGKFLAFGSGVVHTTMWGNRNGKMAKLRYGKLEVGEKLLPWEGAKVECLLLPAQMADFWLREVLMAQSEFGRWEVGGKWLLSVGEVGCLWFPSVPTVNFWHQEMLMAQSSYGK
jgi:hypothetical protein